MNLACSSYGDALRRAERRLAPLTTVGGPLDPSVVVARDEADAFDATAVAAIYRVGLAASQIPAHEGGELDALHRLVAGAYALSRRDASLALTVGLDVWSQLVWMAGTAAQRARVGEVVRRGEGICLAASESEHGADLVASGTRAELGRDGWTLHGDKWPIGRATHSRLALVLARTEASPGPRSASWLLVDTETVAGVELRRLPRVPTLGFRAADVSGLSMAGVRVGEDAIVGERGRGVELALRLFQITRPLVASLALGPADTALRLATRFCCERRLYGGRATDLPAVRRSLVGAWARLCVAEGLALTTVRTAHARPEQLVVASAACKALLPTFARDCVKASAEVLGARFFFRDGFGAGAFQKALRDQLAVATFDGSTPVCLHGLGLQLTTLLRSPHRDPHAWRSCVDLGAETVPLRYDEIGLTSRGRDAVVEGADEIAALGPDDALGRLAADAAGDLLRISERLRVARADQPPGLGRSAVLLGLAEAYAMVRTKLSMVAAARLSPWTIRDAVMPLAFAAPRPGIEADPVGEDAIEAAFAWLKHAAYVDAPLSGWADGA